MKRNLLLLIMIMMIIPIVASAGITGILSGKVVDEKGKPIGGASIRVVGTNRGGNSKLNGTFVISNITAGSYDVLVKFVNYRDYTGSVRISADQTTEITVKMVESVVQTKIVEKTAERISAALVDESRVGTSRVASGDENVRIARETVQQIVALSAGVQTSGAGFEIRGARATETQIRVDGLDVGDQFTGGFSGAGINYTPAVSNFAVEEVQVLTGAFSAEYGNALGGIVNAVVKTGRTNRYEGFARWRTDAPTLFGKSDNGLKLMGKNENSYDVGVGGPIPELEGTTFYITGKYTHEQHVNNRLGLIDPFGNNIGQLDNNQAWVKNITGRLKFAFSNINVSVGGQFGLSSRERGSWGWNYANDLQVTNIRTEGGRTFGDTGTVRESAAKPAVVNNYVNNLFVLINHTLSSNSYYEFKVSTNTNKSEFAKRSNFDNPSLFSGIEVYKPVDELTSQSDPSNPYKLITGKDRVVDVFESLTLKTLSDDGYYAGNFVQRNHITGFIENGADALSTKNPYGLAGYFNQHGNERAYDFRNSNFLQFDGNFNTVINSSDSVKHNIKAGFELRTFVVSRFQNSLPWDGNGFYDVYTDDPEFPNLYADNDVAKRITQQSKKPISGAVYVQDQISYKGIIFNPGLRFDFTDPNSTYRLVSTPFTPITSDSGFGKTTLKYQVSPRITIAYPVTKRSIVNISYGVYFQMPQLGQLFDAFNVDRLRGNEILGDPQIPAQRTNQYQVAYNLQLTDDFAFDVTAYYKDNFNQVGVRRVVGDGVTFFEYSVSEYGNSRGLEFTFKKRATNNIGLNFNYTLASSNTTASSSTSNYNVAVDNYTRKTLYPLDLTPFDGDRRHQLTAIIDFLWSRDEGPSIGGIKPLENVNLNFTTRFQTGTPYTRLSPKGIVIGENNAERQPSSWRTDMRFSKRFSLKDWFGEGIGNTSVDFFVDVLNIFNLTNYVSVYARSGDPDQDNDGYNKNQGDFSQTTYYRDPSLNNSASISSDQYDRFGSRYYSVQADANNDGKVTQLETFQAYQKYVRDAQSLRVNYQNPRQVFFGFMLTF